MSGSKKSVGEGILEGLREAVSYQRGMLAGAETRKVLTARTAEYETAPLYSKDRIVRLRMSLDLSQPVFAGVLNVSANTVRAWEQGKRAPEGAAVRLLQVAEEHPQWIRSKVGKRDKR